MRSAIMAGADIGFTNGFRFGVPVASTITEGDLWNILPMEARMKKGWVTGKELKAYWEDELEMVYSKSPMKLNGGWGPRASGMDIVFDAYADHGRRVVSIKVGGQEIKDDGRYTIAGCERGGEPIDVICRHRGSHDPEILSFSIHEALSRYLEKHRLISPQAGRPRKGSRFAGRGLQSGRGAGRRGFDARRSTTPQGLPPVPTGFSPG